MKDYFGVTWSLLNFRKKCMNVLNLDEVSSNFKPGPTFA